MAAFNARLFRVTRRAKALQIVENKRQFRMCTDGLNVIDFKPSRCCAFHATELIAAKRLQAKALPAFRVRDTLGIAAIFFQSAYTNRPAF
jgi:hypothetical protein